MCFFTPGECVVWLEHGARGEGNV